MAGLSDRTARLFFLKTTHDMKKKLVFIVLLPFLASCCKDDDNNPMPPVITCMAGLDNFTEPASEVADSSIMACDDCIQDCEELYSPAIPYDYEYPCFNPGDPEQLAYYRYDNTGFNFASELWVADFCTGEKKMIADNVLYGLDWSVKDWLVYTAADQNIWKIKSNGDSLTQLTFMGDFNRHPKWNPDGDKIAYNTQTGSFGHFIIINENGAAMDTIEELRTAGAWSWVDKDRICYMAGEYNGSFTTQKMNIYNTRTKEIRFLHNLIIRHTNDSLVLNTVSFPSDNSVVWCARGIIGKTDLSTGSFEILRERLYHEHFRFLTVRPGEEEIVFNKGSRYYVGNCRFDTEYDFFIINKDGTEQRKIILPE